MKNPAYSVPEFGIGSAVCGFLSLILFKFSESGQYAILLSVVALILSLLSFKTEKQERIYAWVGLLSSLGVLLVIAFLFIVFYNGHC
jgi:hypothetical protein